jgi:hypothetical protein
MASSNHDMDGPPSSDSPSTTPDDQNEVGSWVRRKPIPRKGHTKSRRGCFNCKRRRIKCNEKHPDCNHCIKAGLQCEYPLNIINTAQGTSTPHARELSSLPPTPETFVSYNQAHSPLRQILTTLGKVRHALIPSFSRYRVSTPIRQR